MKLESSYRPHDPGNDYYDRGIYHITLVVSGRERLLSSLNMDARQPGVTLTELGRAVMACWEEIPRHHAQRGRKLKLHACVCMPDHFHGVIEVMERMDVSVGEVICGFKTGCTKAWRELTGARVHEPYTARENGRNAADANGRNAADGNGRNAADGSGRNAADGNGQITGVQPYMAAMGQRDLHHMSRRQRREYYDRLVAMGLRIETPLFDDNYDDTVCLKVPARKTDGGKAEQGKADERKADERKTDGGKADGGALFVYDERHLAAMINYVNDNPRRAIIRRLHPEYMKRCMHLRIATGRLDADGKPEMRDYAAFGNLFLLKWVRKVQVFCHRKARYGMLTEGEKRQWGYLRSNAADGAVGRHENTREATYADDFITRVPYEKTEAYRNECREWKRMVMEGDTVMVTPGISMGERFIKDRCIESGYPLIHIQKEAIGQYWKPEQSRFTACENGRLLILAPWKAETMGDVNGVPSETDYSTFHNLNSVAEEVCEGLGDGGG